MSPEVPDEAAPEDLVPRLLARSRGMLDRPLVVLDPGWPANLRDRARRTVHDAHELLRHDDLVLFTSGSSGLPRGVVRTVASWTASLPALSTMVGDRSVDDLVWIPGPLTSSLFLYGAFHAAWSGRRWVCGPPNAHVVQGATHAHLVPLMLADALDAADQGLLARMHTVVVAGAALPAHLRHRAAQHGWRVVEYYGAAELSFVGWRADDGPLRPFPGTRVRIGADPDDGSADRPTSTPGDIWVRSPYVARQYLSPGDGGPWQTQKGWSTVHDRGRPASDGGDGDGDGWSVLGRGDAAITTGGTTVVVADVEEALRDVPGVLALAVVAAPHPRFGEIVVVLVQPRTGVDHAALLTRLRARARDLPTSARPRRWLEVGRLPRLSSGKVDRDQAVALVTTAPPLR